MSKSRPLWEVRLLNEKIHVVADTPEEVRRIVADHILVRKLTSKEADRVERGEDL